MLAYPAAMARGWESKAVEAQQDDAGRGRPTGPALSPEELARRTRRETLGLALADAQAKLAMACRPAHREMVRRQIASIEAALLECAGGV
jgi:hypothetical protein